MNQSLPPVELDTHVALRLLNQGLYSQALDLAERALALQNEHPGWLSIMAVALSELRLAERALPVYEQLTRLQPSQAVHWSNLGNCLCELGRERLALEPLIQAMLLGAQDAALHYALARVYSIVGPMELARRHIGWAIEKAPQDTEMRLLQIRILSALDLWEGARTGLAEVKKMHLNEGERNELGYLLQKGLWFEDALTVFRQPAVSPQVQADQNIGQVLCLERLNRLDEARIILDALNVDIIKKTPKLYDNFLQMSTKIASREKRFSDVIATILELQQNQSHDADTRTNLSFELAAAYDKTSQQMLAMQSLADAHAIRKSMVDRDHPSLSGSAGLLAVLDGPVPTLPSNSGCIADGFRDPLFVVGFPRSGTTLLEQLLDAHNELVSFDEQPLLQRIIQQLSVTGETVEKKLATLSATEISDLRSGYFATVQNLTQGLNHRRAVDKNPLNMVRLPLLQNIFPEAQVVLAIRHPCDVVLSCYMQHFRAPAFALTFETLESTAQMYDKVFSRWYENIDKFHWPVLEWKYEDLVADTEGRARDLFDFLQLPWQDDLLAFTERAKHKGAINTPSYTQVIEQVNARAVGRWQAYKAYFTPAVMKHLNPWLERFGYLA